MNIIRKNYFIINFLTCPLYNNLLCAQKTVLIQIWEVRIYQSQEICEIKYKFLLCSQRLYISAAGERHALFIQFGVSESIQRWTFNNHYYNFDIYYSKVLQSITMPFTHIHLAFISAFMSLTAISTSVTHSSHKCTYRIKLKFNRLRNLNLDHFSCLNNQSSHCENYHNFFLLFTCFNLYFFFNLTFLFAPVTFIHENIIYVKLLF